MISPLFKVLIVLFACVSMIVVLRSGDKEPHRRGRLRKHCPDPNTNREGDANINIIVIPEFGLSNLLPSKDKSWDWLDKDLKSIAPQAEILIFDYNIIPGETSIWQSLIERGGELLHSLIDGRQRFGIAERPLIFVCHGLGGLILKQAIVKLNEEDYDPALQRFLIINSSIVFLGTPHPSNSHREQWFRLGLILNSYPKISKFMRVQAELEANLISNLSLQFEEAKLDCPVISTFETKTTKINEGFFRSRREILVGKALAETSVRREILIEVSSDHNDIRNVRKGSAVFSEMAALVLSALSQPAPPNTDQGLEEEPISNFKWATTASSVDIDDARKLSFPTSSPMYATLGTTDRSALDAVPSVADILEPKPKPSLPCHLLKPQSRLSDFHAREDILARLDEALLPFHHGEGSAAVGPKAFALCGLGGVGKTQVAVEFAFTRKDQFDAVFWIQADESSKLAESFNQIATALRLTDVSDVGDYVVSRSVVMEWLAAPSRAIEGPNEEDEPPDDANVSWLLIFDNADDLEILRDYWPVGGSRGSILITSRDPLAKTYHHNKTSGIDLEPFTQREAATLLQHLTSQPAEAESQAEMGSLLLSERLGRLPLAITQAAAVIRRRDLTFQEMVQMYEEDVGILHAKQPKLTSRENQYGRTLSTVWALEDLTATAADILDVISLLDPDRIQEEILTSQVLTHQLQYFPSSYPKYTEARTELLKSSLVKRNKEENYLMIHRLVQDSTKARMTESRLRAVFEFVVELLLSAWPSNPVKFSHTTVGWKTGEQILPHILKLDSFYMRHTEMIESISEKGHLAELLKQGGWYLKERGSFDLAKPLLTHALALVEQMPNKLHVLRGDLLFSLASLAGESNDAHDHLSYAMRHHEARLQTGEQDKDLGMAYAELSISLSTNKMYSPAIEAAQTSFSIYRKTADYLNGSYWPHFAIIHQALALLALNRGKESIGMLHDTLKWRHEQYGADDTESFKLGYVLQILGNIFVQEDRWPEAFDAYQKALANYKATVGMNYHRSGHLCVKLAECHARLQQYETAEVFLDQAIRSFKSHPYYAPEIARTQFIKSQILRDQGDDLGAKEALEQAEKMYDELVPSHKCSRTPLMRKDVDEIVFIWSR